MAQKNVGIVNKYFSFTDELYEKFHNLKDLVKNSSDIEHNKDLIKEFERIFTLENAKAIKEIQKNTNEKNRCNWFSWANNIPITLKKKFPYN